MSEHHTEKYEETLVRPPTDTLVVSSHQTSVTLTKVYSEGKIVVKEDTEEIDVDVRMPPPGTPMAEVGADARMTINMGNYESIQIGISIKLPCVVEEVQDCYKAARSLVDLHLNKEVGDVRTYRDLKKRED